MPKIRILWIANVERVAVDHTRDFRQLTIGFSWREKVLEGGFKFICYPDGSRCFTC